MASSAEGSRNRDRSVVESLAAGHAPDARTSLLPRHWKTTANWIATIAVVVIVFSFLNHRFASFENLRNIFEQASVPLIIVVGTTFIIVMGSIDLSVQGVMAAAGYFNVWALVVSLTVAAIVGDAVGYYIGRKAGPTVLSSTSVKRAASASAANHSSVAAIARRIRCGQGSSSM